ncbi:hypothetical protein [Mycobacterium sp. MMS18-G62]
MAYITGICAQCGGIVDIRTTTHYAGGGEPVAVTYDTMECRNGCIGHVWDPPR